MTNIHETIRLNILRHEHTVTTDWWLRSANVSFNLKNINVGERQMLLRNTGLTLQGWKLFLFLHALSSTGKKKINKCFLLSKFLFVTPPIIYDLYCCKLSSPCCYRAKSWTNPFSISRLEQYLPRDWSNEALLQLEVV